MLILYELPYSQNGVGDYYYLFIVITFPFIYTLFSRLTYSESVLNNLKGVLIEDVKHIKTKQFVHYFITLILLIVFIYGVYTISHATKSVNEWVFKEYDRLDETMYKNFVLEERLKGGILAILSGMGLLIKYIFSTNHYYKK
ncbi:hypothetical protein KHQ81_11475 [Mycoplasmatota bacterium]|nr:hypothetical protein KHQ81_11475 [Mycoplasmatota bacterium]